MFCCKLLYVHSTSAIILMGKSELVSLLIFLVSRDCVWLFLAVLCVCLRFVIVVFPDHTTLLFLLKVILKTLNSGITLKTNTQLHVTFCIATLPFITYNSNEFC